MANHLQAFDFLKSVYREVWQSYSERGLYQRYDGKVIGRSEGRDFCYEELHDMLKTHALDLNHMRPEFHQVMANFDNQILAWFTTIHYTENQQESYRLRTMASYTIKDDKVIRVDFMWDKPVDFVMQRLYAATPVPAITNSITGKALSRRELECFFHLIQGRFAKEIAREMQVSRRTVEAHIIHIKDKLDLNNSREIIDFAIKHGYLTLAPMFSRILNAKY